MNILAALQAEPGKFPSGITVTPQNLVDGVPELAKDWIYEAFQQAIRGLSKKGKL